MSSSLVITPYKTIYSPSFGPYHFSVFLDKDNSNLFKGNPSPRERTEKRDRSGNRYSVRSLLGHQGAVSAADFYDKMIVATGSQDCTIKLWNYHTRKCLNTVNTATEDTKDNNAIPI